MASPSAPSETPKKLSKFIKLSRTGTDGSSRVGGHDESRTGTDGSSRRPRRECFLRPARPDSPKKCPASINLVTPLYDIYIYRVLQCSPQIKRMSTSPSSNLFSKTIKQINIFQIKPYSHSC